MDEGLFEGAAGFVVAAAEAGARLDRLLLSRHPEAGRAGVLALLAAGSVRVNGRVAPKGARLAAGDEVSLQALPRPVAATADPDAAARLRVVYGDPALLVIDKPAGMPSHPLRPGERGTLADGLLHLYPELSGVGYGPREPGLVHRLDTDTSGLLLIARDASTFDAFGRALRDGEVHKTYLALCAGAPPEPVELRGHLRATGPVVQLRDAPFDGSRPVRQRITRSEPCDAAGCCRVWVEAPFAARHQVRALLAHAGLPLVGDVAYGGPAREGGGHLLHACALSFSHPRDGRNLSLQSAPPPAFDR